MNVGPQEEQDRMLMQPEVYMNVGPREKQDRILMQPEVGLVPETGMFL